MNKEHLITELLTFFSAEGFLIHGAVESPEHPAPPLIQNNGFGDGKSRRPDVVGVDRKNERIVFGLVRPDRASLDSEESLTQYNLFLDHKWNHGAGASMLYVMMPGDLVAEFTAIITHYIHREYWHRIVPVATKGQTENQ